MKPIYKTKYASLEMGLTADLVLDQEIRSYIRLYNQLCASEGYKHQYLFSSERLISFKMGFGTLSHPTKKWDALLYLMIITKAIQKHGIEIIKTFELLNELPDGSEEKENAYKQIYSEALGELDAKLTPTDKNFMHFDKELISSLILSEQWGDF